MPYVTLSEHDGVFHLREIADESVDALDSAGIHVHLIGEAELAAWEGHCAASAAWHAHWIRVKNDGYERADRRMLEEELIEEMCSNGDGAFHMADNEEESEYITEQYRVVARLIERSM